MMSLSGYMPVTILVRDGAQLAAVYALLSGGSATALAAGNLPTPSPTFAGSTASEGTGASGANTTSASEAAGSSAGASTSGSATNTASPSDGERDAAGVVWDPSKHASTKGKTKAGLWRMKVGVTRPEGEGVDATEGNSDAPSGQSSAPTSPVEEEDEFAAFRAAASGGQTQAQARNWTDADLSNLCNQAAVSTGNPENVKAIIAKYIPEGQQQHSRNIPADQRETFARDVETTLNIQYAG